ncbi:hypothetical protein IFO70_33235 [Phormidium tenue FACHB-886]|nr:hypothetical protein [Phormidium tenue FACHB-886]
MKVQVEILMPQGGFTFEEMQSELHRMTGIKPARSSLYRWLTKVCLLETKPLYSQSDLEWVIEWLTFRATRCNSIEAFHRYMQSKVESQTNA